MVTYDAVQLLPYFSFIDSSNNVFRYTENSYHRPIFGSAINPSAVEAGTILYSFTNATPRKGREFSEIELPVSLDDIEALTDISPAANCIRIQKSVGKPKPLMIYGWVDSIEPISTKGPSKNTLIRFHVDYWLTEQYYTWFANTYSTTLLRSPVRFANGRVKRGPASMARPDPSTPRIWKYDSAYEIIDSYFGNFVILLYTKTSGNYTTIREAVWPLGRTVDNSSTSISAEMIYNGVTEEAMGIDPDSIIGVWFSPLNPLGAGVSGYEKHNTYDNVQYGWWDMPSNKIRSSQYIDIDPSNILKTDDMTKYVLIDANETTISTLPWGIEFQRIVYWADVGTSGAYLYLAFVPKTATSFADVSLGEGRIIQVPLIAAPVTSNAKSSYVLSGQYDYDKEMAKYQQQANLMSGLAGTGQSIGGGVASGALAGGGVGAAIGAVAGGMSSIIGSGVSYWIQGDYDRKSREAMDRLLSNQATNIIISGGGRSWQSIMGGKWRLLKLVRDSESAAELTGEQTELGYVTDAFTTNAGTLIAAGGPLRIEGLQVDGDITPAGRANIQALFARGVHLDLIQ